jgi:hypothetical protein
MALHTHFRVHRWLRSRMHASAHSNRMAKTFCFTVSNAFGKIPTCTCSVAALAEELALAAAGTAADVPPTATGVIRLAFLTSGTERISSCDPADCVHRLII